MSSQLSCVSILVALRLKFAFEAYYKFGEIKIHPFAFLYFPF